MPPLGNRHVKLLSVRRSKDRFFFFLLLKERSFSKGFDKNDDDHSYDIVRDGVTTKKK